MFRLLGDSRKFRCSSGRLEIEQTEIKQRLCVSNWWDHCLVQQDEGEGTSLALYDCDFAWYPSRLILKVFGINAGHASEKMLLTRTVPSNGKCLRASGKV